MESGSGSDVSVLVVSIAIIPAVFIVFILCIKIKVSRSNPDIYGVEGTVTRKCEDQLNVSNGSSKLAVPAVDENTTRTPSYDRKLPELPEDVYRTASTKDDNTSELYATVDDNIARSSRPEGSDALSDALPQLDRSHHPYARVKKQAKQEHPYAKLGEGQNGKQQLDDEDDDGETEYETTEKLDPAPPADNNYPFPPAPDTNFPFPAPLPGSFAPWVPPPARNTSRQSTPLPPEPSQNQPLQQHFSGDSQESTYSTKGYTSISVREPLENLRPQVQHSTQPPIQEGNYVTLSETSDEMYAAIEDTVYMDPMGSAHATNRQEHQQRRVEEDPNIMYSKIDKSKKRSERPTASYDNGYATVNKVKSRLGKKEKPDPGYETVPYNSKLSDGASGGPGPSGAGTRDCTDVRSRTDTATQYKDPEYEVLPGECKDGKALDGRDPDYETVPSGSQSREPGYETLPPRFRADSLDPGYETLSKRGAGPRSYPEYAREYREPGYETVSELRTMHDPDYESVAAGGAGRPAGAAAAGRTGTEPGYETTGEEPGYETVPDNATRSLPLATQSITEESCSNSTGVNSRSIAPGSGGARPRAAPAMQTPSPPSSSLQNRRMMSGVSEPELHSKGIVDTTIEYQSMRNYPPPKPKKSVDSEEGYETIPDISKSSADLASPSDTTARLASPEQSLHSTSSRSAVGVPPALSPGNRSAPPLPEPFSGSRSGFPGPNSGFSTSHSLSDQGNQFPFGDEDTVHGYERITARNPEASTDLTIEGIKKTDSKSRFDNEEITYIDEETTPVTPGSSSASENVGEGISTVETINMSAVRPTDCSPSSRRSSPGSGGGGVGTPGSPTIHMSVVNTTQGVRRASVVMIERVEDEKESLTSFDNHVFV